VIITFHRCPFGVHCCGRVGKETRPFKAHVLNAGILQLHPHEDGEGNRNQADDTGREQVKDPDILVVCRHEPAGKEPAGVMMVTVAMYGCVCHASTP